MVPMPGMSVRDCPPKIGVFVIVELVEAGCSQNRVRYSRATLQAVEKVRVSIALRIVVGSPVVWIDSAMVRYLCLGSNREVGV